MVCHIDLEYGMGVLKPAPRYNDLFCWLKNFPQKVLDIPGNSEIPLWVITLGLLFQWLVMTTKAGICAGQDITIFDVYRVLQPLLISQ